MTLAESLAALAANPPSPSKGPKCYVCRWYAQATPEERDAFDAACQVVRVSAADIARTLAAGGIVLPEHSVSRHRRGACRGGS